MLQPQPHDEPDRLRAFLGSAGAGLPQPFDEGNALHVDKAAELLLKRFFAENDGDAFELLVETTLPLLNGAAEDVAREVGVAAGARTLLTGIFSRIFISPRRPAGLQDAAFLSWMVREARKVATAHVGELAARAIPVAETSESTATEGSSHRAQSAHGGGILGRLAMAVASSNEADLDSVGLSMSTVVEIVFHRLPADHRRILRCIEVARMSHDGAARFLEIAPEEIGDRAARARAELQAGVQAAVESIADKLSCALDGEAAKTVSAEQLASHLVTCERCSGTADLMSSLGDVGGWLTSVADSPGKATLMEQVLAGVNTGGKDELARVLYEMIRACLEVGDRQRVDPVVPPNSTEELRFAAEAIVARGESERGSASGLRITDPVAAAERCANLLEAVESGSIRARFGRGVVQHAQLKLDDAVTSFQSVADDPATPTRTRSHARIMILWSLLRQKKYEETLALASEMYDRAEEPKWSAMYHVWVAGWLQDHSLFDRAAAMYRSATIDEGSSQWWVRLAQAEANWLAERLDLPPDIILTSLGGSD